MREIYHRNGKRRDQEAAELLTKMTVEDVAKVMGISTLSVRTYGKHMALSKARQTDNLPRCQCGLLLPCTCTGPRRAEEFMGRKDEIW
jgi:hypothetical protein